MLCEFKCFSGDIGYDSLELSDIRLDDPFYIQSEKHLPEMDIEGVGSNDLMDLDDGGIAPVELDRGHEEMMDVAESQTPTSGVPLPATELLAEDLSDYGNAIFIKVIDFASSVQ